MFWNKSEKQNVEVNKKLSTIEYLLNKLLPRKPGSNIKYVNFNFENINANNLMKILKHHFNVLCTYNVLNNNFYIVYIEKDGNIDIDKGTVYPAIKTIELSDNLDDYEIYSNQIIVSCKNGSLNILKDLPKESKYIELAGKLFKNNEYIAIIIGKENEDVIMFTTDYMTNFKKFVINKNADSIERINGYDFVVYNDTVLLSVEWIDYKGIRYTSLYELDKFKEVIRYTFDHFGNITRTEFLID